MDVQLDATSAQVVPYAGAVVMLKFKTENGRTVIVSTHFKDGQAVPFGAEVLNQKGDTLGVVGQAGQVLLRGVDQSGRLTAHWQDDKGAQQSCSFDYRLAGKDDHTQSLKQYEQLVTVCSMPLAAAHH